MAATNQLNPFARSRLKLEESVRLVSSEYRGWSNSYQLVYSVSRLAANAGLLERQFKPGAIITIEGNNLIVTQATMEIEVSEARIQVDAVPFSAVLAGAQVRLAPASQAAVSGAPRAATPLKSSVVPAPVLRTTGRKLAL
jgi:hypothetical protein